MNSTRLDILIRLRSLDLYEAAVLRRRKQEAERRAHDSASALQPSASMHHAYAWQAV